MPNSNISKTQAKINQALYGITVAQEFPEYEYNKTIRLSQDDPPSYIVRLALMIFLESNLPKYHEKSDWGVHLLFDNIVWSVNDWKRYKWQVEGPPNKDDSAEKLVKKLKNAANIADHFVKTVIVNAQNNEDFYLHNQFWRTKRIYSVFRHHVETMLEELSPIASSEGIKDDGEENNVSGSIEEFFSAVSKQVSMQLRKEAALEANVVATASMFFALTETIFDVCFALSDRKNMSFADFRKQDWKDRTKHCIDVEDKVFKSLYQELLRVRNHHRNIVIHASPTYLYQLPGFPGFGLIPSSFEQMDYPHMRSVPGVTPSEALDLLTLFDKFLTSIQSHDSTRLAYYYAASGLPIPISINGAAELRSYMSNPDDFVQEVNKRIDFQVAIENMDV